MASLGRYLPEVEVFGAAVLQNGVWLSLAPAERANALKLDRMVRIRVHSEVYRALVRTKLAASAALRMLVSRVSNLELAPFFTISDVDFDLGASKTVEIGSVRSILNLAVVIGSKYSDFELIVGNYAITVSIHQIEQGVDFFSAPNA